MPTARRVASAAAGPAAAVAARRMTAAGAGYRCAMVPGIVLLIIGAVFTFALRTDGSWMNTRVLGVILMLGGVAFVVRALLGRRAVVVTEEEYDADGGSTDATHQRHVVIEKRQD